MKNFPLTSGSIFLVKRHKLYEVFYYHSLHGLTSIGLLPSKQIPNQVNRGEGKTFTVLHKLYSISHKFSL